MKQIKKLLKSNPEQAKALIDKTKSVFEGVDEKTNIKYQNLKMNTYLALAIKNPRNFSIIDLVVGQLKNVDTNIYNNQIGELTKKVSANAQNDYENKNTKRAISGFEKVYRLSPRDTVFLYSAASLSTTTPNTYDLALKYYKELMDIGYDGSRMEYSAKNNTTGKREVYRKAMRDMYIKMGTHSEPEDNNIPSSKATIVKNIAMIYTQQGKNEEALKAFKIARKDNPNDTSLILTEANVVYAMGNKQRFKELMAEAMEKEPNNPDLYYNAGVVNSQLKLFDEAIGNYKKAIELKPNYKNAIINISGAYLEKGNLIIKKLDELSKKNKFKEYDRLKVKKNKLYKKSAKVLEDYIKESGDKDSAIFCFTVVLSPLFLSANGIHISSDFVQQETISGTVVDQDGQPLFGVSVVEKGTSNGVTTNSDGDFTLSISSQGAILLVRFLGFSNQEVVASDGVVIQLEIDNAKLDEVIVVGYGTEKKSDLTGSVSSVKGEVVKQMPFASVDQAVQSRVAGVQVTQASAAPGGGVSVRIRGTNSINSGSEPLYVIDGFPVYPDNSAYSTGGNRQASNVMATINPNDIASIEILKDASATSIYGSRGSNGVVLITTKRGSQGEAKITYDGSYSLQQIANPVKVLDARGYVRYQNARGSKAFSNVDIEKLGKGTNWLEEITQIAPIQNHQLSISGGNAKNKYAISGNYFGNEGILKHTYFDRYSIRLNLDNSLLDNRVKVASSWTFSHTKSNNAPTDRKSPVEGGIVLTALGLNPTEPIRDKQGKYNLVDYDGRFKVNPLQELENIKDLDKINRVLGNTSVSIDILKGLNFKTSIGLDAVNSSRRTFYPHSSSYLGRENSGELTMASLESFNVLNENILSYNKEIMNGHLINVIVGYTSQNEESIRFSSAIRNISIEDNARANLQNNALILTPYSGRRQWSLESLLSRVNYTLGNKYLFTFTFRRDGSSRFGDANKWANFPSLALGWKVHEEKFMKNSNISRVLSALKIRGSWGITGNSEIPLYSSIADLKPKNYIFNNSLSPGLAQTRLANPELRWESTRMLNFGLDMSLFKSRLNITTDYFYNVTEDLLLNVSIPRSLGFSNILKNSGSLENKGFEVAVDGMVISTDKFSWSASANFTILRNKILDLGDSPPFYSRGAFAEHLSMEGSWVEKGMPIGVWKGYKFKGIFQSQKQIDNSPSRTNDKPGYPIYEDTNRDGKITPDDYQIIGDPNPDFTFGFSTAIAYKNFELNALIRGVMGNDVRNVQQAEMGDGVQNINQIASVISDSWSPSNKDGTRAIIDSNRDFANSYRDSDFFIEDGSFIRLQNISLSYTLPKMKYISRIKLNLGVQNPYVWTKYTGFDPEVNNGGQSNLNRDGIKSGLTGVYDGVGYGGEAWWYFYNRFVFECRVGYQVGWEKGPLNFQGGNVEKTDEYILKYWTICYDYINRANNIIASADKLIKSGIEGEDKKKVERFKAEAKFLRAFFYFSLVRYFDDIPVKDKPTKTEKDFVSNEGGKRKALDLIEEDLETISNILPKEYQNADIGRATKWAAMTLLAKAYLLDEKWQKAYDTSKQIIDNSGISLFPDFSHNFDVAHENMGERIFESQSSYSVNSDEVQNAHPHFSPRDLPTDLGGVSWGWLNGTLQFRLMYDDNDKRIAGTFLQSYKTNRIKKQNKVPYPTITWTKSLKNKEGKELLKYGLGTYDGMVAEDADPNNPEELKFSVPWVAKWKEDISSFMQTEKNVVFLRYADVLLINSEAANELNRSDRFDGINEVLDRAGLPGLSGLNKEELLDEIMKQRMLEFAFEAEVYPEYKRRSTFNGGPHKDYLGDYIKKFIEEYNTEEYKLERKLSAKDYVLPIPQNEILANPKIKQNKAYE
ncbi:TonB-linked outer membrane protein, SusC/RagA family [Elysia marginata]|uniref:TonB-linked outer membrane protein, SusC/RagA family n=1 Tax=Elysia marginata TaxID=1093978 RepID=A0AAV4G6H0_9GAST|nr:TonB-linked outer membrane protein, SusC/RagA family [Elysia marginata]